MLQRKTQWVDFTDFSDGGLLQWHLPASCLSLTTTTTSSLGLTAISRKTASNYSLTVTATLLSLKSAVSNTFMRHADYKTSKIHLLAPALSLNNMLLNLFKGITLQSQKLLSRVTCQVEVYRNNLGNTYFPMSWEHVQSNGEISIPNDQQ